MARRSGIDFSVGAIRRVAKQLSKKASHVDLVAKRATTTLVRRAVPEAARIISSDVLNLPSGRVSRNLKATQLAMGGEGYLILSASRVRLPLSDYTPRVSRNDGVTVTTWRDGGAKRYPRAFKRRDKKGIWQRIPAGGAGKFRPSKGSPSAADPAPSGLVQRLPVVQRKGPSMHRVFETRGRYAGHVDISGRLTTFAAQVLSQEIARLLRASST